MLPILIEKAEGVVARLIDSIRRGPTDEVRTPTWAELDLNKLSKEEIDRVKAEMDKDYEKNRIRSQDSNFVYDMRVICFSFDPDATD